ncbi:hypothetical protein EXVG_00394 [Emiliania huxleyi virus 202]|nr:hypothetical protein EXVG_00394 [Emiliania huxleyi virus 202]AHA54352.1 putative membrane protein [Emiliania huxleyi virus 18]AHA55390.1 putative membrane protein [Emiliania huxleyi virus 156]
MDTIVLTINWFNFIAGLFHVALAIVCALLGDVSQTFKMYMPFTTFRNGTQENEVTIKYSGYFPMTVIFVVYFSVTALFHMGNAFLWNDTYHRFLSNRKNPIRWTEYSITAPLMTAILAFIAGSRNWLFVIAASTLTFASISVGFVLDEIRKYSFFVLGMIPFLVEFSLIILSLYLTTSCYPSYLPITIFVEFGLWILFPFVSLLELSGINYKIGELVFIVLSFVSKSVLAIILNSENVLKNGVTGIC